MPANLNCKKWKLERRLEGEHWSGNLDVYCYRTFIYMYQSRDYKCFKRKLEIKGDHFANAQTAPNFIILILKTA